jgi:hypothetical protein
MPRVGAHDVRGRPGNRYANCGPRASHVGDAGAIAQLVERLHGMQEVSGSSPLSSTQVRRIFSHTEPMSFLP